MQYIEGVGLDHALDCSRPTGAYHDSDDLIRGDADADGSHSEGSESHPLMESISSSSGDRSQTAEFREVARIGVTWLERWTTPTAAQSSIAT